MRRPRATNLRDGHTQVQYLVRHVLVRCTACCVAHEREREREEREKREKRERRERQRRKGGVELWCSRRVRFCVLCLFRAGEFVCGRVRQPSQMRRLTPNPKGDAIASPPPNANSLSFWVGGNGSLGLRHPTFTSKAILQTLLLDLLPEVQEEKLLPEAFGNSTGNMHSRLTTTPSQISLY